MPEKKKTEKIWVHDPYCPSMEAGLINPINWTYKNLQSNWAHLFNAKKKAQPLEHISS